MGDFLRVDDPSGKGFIRGPARCLLGSIAQAFPVNLSELIVLAAPFTSEVQTITITGAPAGGSYFLAFKGQQTGPIAFNATSGAVQTALRGLGSIGSTGVTVAGGPGPATPYVVTFAGPLASNDQPLMVADGSAFTGGTTPAIAVTETTPGVGLFDPKAGWSEVGATRGGVQIGRNNTQEDFDVDQQISIIRSDPTNWEMFVQTALAEATLAHIQLCWEGGPITIDATPTTGAETHMGVGEPLAYTQKKLAIMHRRNSPASPLYHNKIRALVLRKTQRSPQESTLTFARTGEQQTIPQRWGIIGDDSVADSNYRFGEFIDQGV